MANREIVPGGIYPLLGDVESIAGQNTVTVTGIQTTPVAPDAPQTGQLLVMGADGEWHPEDPVVSGTDAVGTAPSKAPVQVAGIDDTGLVREIKTDQFGKVQTNSQSNNERIELLIREVRALKSAVIALDETQRDSDYSSALFADPETDI